MQCSAWRPTASASTRVRPLSSRIDVQLARAVAVHRPGPDRRVRVHPLAGGRARQELEEHLEILPARHQLLDPDDADQHLRERRAHPPVALGLQHHQAARLGHGEVGPADADARPQEPLAQVPARRLGQLRRVVRQLGVADRAAEQVADLGAVAVDGRHQDVRRPVAVQLQDQLGEVGLDGVDAGGGERVVQPDLVRGQRLDLDHLVGAVAARDGHGDGVASSASRAQCTSPPAAVNARSNSSRCRSSERIVRSLITRPASRSSSQSASSPTVARRLRRIVAVAWPRLRRSWRPPQLDAGRAGEARRLRRAVLTSPPGSRPGASSGRPAATPQAAAEVHQARVVCGGDDLGAALLDRSSLSSIIAVETSAFLTANVPPNPQHWSASASGDQLDAADRAEQPLRPVADAAARAASGRSGGSRRGAGSARRRRRRRARRSGTRSARRPAARARRARTWRGAGGRRRDDRIGPGEDAAEALDQRKPLVAVAGVEVHLAAAGLLLPELDGAAQPLQQLHHRPPGAREQGVVEAGDEERDGAARRPRRTPRAPSP